MKKIMTLMLLSSTFFVVNGDSVSSEESAANRAEIEVENSKSIELDQKVSELEGKIMGIEEPFLELKSSFDKLNKLKISGYIQAQFRHAVGDEAQQDSSGEYTGKYNYAVGNYAGGKFSNGIQNAFQIRRGRLKSTYSNKTTSAVLQVDVIPKGVSIKDAYLSFKEPWLKSFGVKAGLFDRPFGFEISYSSSSRESPERSRLFQTLFPGERDLGLELSYLPSDNLPFAARLLNLKAGIFNGTGIADDNNETKDVIGRLGFSLPFYKQNLSIDGGFSAYRGNVVSVSDTAYDFIGSKFKPKTGRNLDEYLRKYYGGDLQIYYSLPSIGGFSLRGEVIGGTQPGTATSASVYNQAAGSNIYNREFLGCYGMLVQNVDPLKSQLVLKYDYFDPNTGVEAAGIKKSGGLSSTELAYSTLGAGLVYHLDSNIKFMLYYDHITNEKADVSFSTDPKMGYYTEDLKDDVFTFRIQYKF